MAFDLLLQKIDYGEVAFTWDFPEYTRYDRSLLWYLLSAVVVIGLLIYSLVIGNILFAVIIILATIITVYIGRRQPRVMNIKITDEGIVVENRFYPYSDLKNFWIIHEPDIKNLYFEFNSPIIPRLSVPYKDQDPNSVRSYLLQYLEENEEREGEPISEAISRWFKL